MIFKLRAQLIGGVERVVFDDDAPEFLHCEKCCYVLGAVRQQNRHPVPCTHAKFLQAGGCGAHLSVEFAVGLPFTKEACRWLIGIARHIGLVDIT